MCVSLQLLAESEEIGQNFKVGELVAEAELSLNRYSVHSRTLDPA